MNSSLDNIYDYLLESILFEYGKRDFEADVETHARRRRTSTNIGALAGGGVAGAAGYYGSKNPKVAGASALGGALVGGVLGSNRERNRFSRYRKTLPKRFQSDE